MKESIRKIVDEVIHESEYGMRFVTSKNKVDFITDAICEKLWISVKDRFPDKEVDLLLWDGFVRIRGFFDGEIFKSVNHSQILATHWMPLPAPPKQDE